MDYNFKTRGTCSRAIHFSIDENHIITSVKFDGGCNGNLQGISSLVIGEKAEDMIKKLEGINCNGKGTSCPDQLARALREAIAQ